MKVTARRGPFTLIESGLDRDEAGRVAVKHALLGYPCTVTEEEDDVPAYLHDDDCPTCRRMRRAHRRALLVKYAPWVAVAALIALMALGEALTHAVGP